MRFRHRQDEPIESTKCPGGSGTDGGSLVEARKSADDLLNAGDEAIEHALSGDSESFLDASRQEGAE
jgi:hypothetical protein